MKNSKISWTDHTKNFWYDRPVFFKQWGEWYPLGGNNKIIPSMKQQQRVRDGILYIRLGTKLSGHNIFGKEIQQFPEG